MSDQETQQQPASDESAEQRDSKPSERGSGRERGRSGRRRHSGGGSNAPSRSLEQSLNMDELRNLVELISEYGFTDFELENKDVRVRLRRELAPQIMAAPAALPTSAASGPATAAETTPSTGASDAPVRTTMPATTVADAQAEAAAAEEEGLHKITSPIVGTFYRAPSPNAEPFIRLGSHVGPDSVVCIIEAMKLMNEIQSETSGTIEKIYVENGQPVEYGQPLFGVKK